MNQIEPGLLQVSRWTVGVMWLLLTCSVCSNDQPTPPYFAIITWMFSAFLVLYLSWKWLPRHLGNWYFPLVLIVLSLEPIIALWLESVLRLFSGVPLDSVLTDQAILYVWLLLPLLLVSSQYGMRVMFAFNIVTALLPVFLALPFAVMRLPNTNHVVENALVRFLLFTITGVLVVRITNAQRQQRQILTRHNQQLQHYAVTLERLAVSQERNRMARELHDTLAHTLSAVSVQLQAIEAVWEADPNGARDMLTRTQDLARSGLHEARRALQALRASPLEDLGVVLALQNLAQSTADRAGLQLELDLPKEALQVRPEVEQSLYRVSEEAMTNIVRHANAKKMQVRLRQYYDMLELSISDDGHGFDSMAPPNGHFGIVGMKERAALCGGLLDIQSKPGKGATVTFKVKETL